MNKDNRFRLMGSARRVLAALFALVALALLAGGYGYYRFETERIRRHKHHEIAAVAELKAGQIQQWRKERFGDLLRSAGSPFFRNRLAAWLREPGTGSFREDWEERFRIEGEAFGYTDVLLLDPQGNILLSVQDDPHPVQAATARTVEAALISGKPALSDFYRCPTGVVHLDAAAPVRDSEDRVLAVLVLRSNAERFLYPLIQSWPTPGRSGETLLVQREGEEVVFLNDLRHRAGAALSLRYPLSRRDVPAVQAVLGKEGLFQGRDYRGVEVLADLRPIPGSPWFLVAKVDAREILAEARYRGGMIAAFVGLGILLAGAVTAFTYRRRQAGLYEDLYRSERRQREAREEFRITLRSIGDAVISTDREGRVRHMNAVAEELTGWPEDEAMGRPLGEVFRIINEWTRAVVENPVKRVLREGLVVGLANHTVLIHRNGAERPIADSGAPIRDDDGAILGVVLVFRDQSEERAAQKALLDSEDRYRDLVESCRELFCTHDLDGKLLSVNEAAVRFTGYPREELLRMNLSDLLDPEVRHLFGSYLAEIRATGRAGGVMRVRAASGEIRYWEYDNTLRTDDVAVPVVCAIAQDITERRKAESLRKASEERYGALAEGSSDGIVLMDAERNVVDCNQAFVRLFGYEKEQLKGQSIRIIHGSEESFHSFGRLVYPEVRRTGLGRVEWNLVSREGSVIPTEIGLSALTSSDGSITGYVAVIHDITERRKAEDAVRESERRYRTLAENTLDAIWTMDLEARFTYVNPAVQRMFGYSPEEWIGTRLAEHCDEVHLKRMTDLMARELEHPDESRGVIFETVMRRRDGSPIWVEVHAAFLFDEQGRIAGFQGTTRDITERKRAEEEHENLEAQLRQAQKMEAVGRLAGGVAHDFNNMLSVIMGHAELALMGLQPSDPLHGDIREILKAGRRSADLVRQLLAFARKQTIVPIVLDLNETVGSMLKMLGRLIGEDIELAWLPGHGLAKVKMDPAQLDQILANLAVNARDAVVGVGKVTIETTNVELDEVYCETHAGFTPGRYVMLAVSDTGCGMDRETLANAFDPFFTTKPHGQGTGLGLATVYGIVKQNGGFINVYSEPGRGSTFKICLPRFESEEAATEAVRKRVAPPEGKETVLLVEDEKPLLELSRRLLEGLGYTVMAAGDPREAIRRARECQDGVDVLVTDVIMPEMSGRDLWRRLRAERPHLKCLFMSGYTANVISHHGVLDEGVHFLQKPFSRETLAVKLREVLSAEVGSQTSSA